MEVQKFALKPGIMGRGVSFGGGQSSLGYLFGSGEPPKPTTNNAEAPLNQGAAIPAGVPGSKTNNYFRADGQNCGNFLTSSFLRIWKCDVASYREYEQAAQQAEAHQPHTTESHRKTKFTMLWSETMCRRSLHFVADRRCSAYALCFLPAMTGNG
nr:protein SPIRAL1-like 1 [Ipomoea batatas]